jgi:hypothetical protein
MGNRPELLDRTKPDAISLAQGAINGSCFCDTHLGPVDQRRHIGGICIAITNEYFRISVFIDHGFEDPTIGYGIGESFFQNRLNSAASAPESQLEKAGVCYVPSSIEKLKMACCHREAIGVSQLG